MNIDHAIENIEKLYQRITGEMAPPPHLKTSTYLGKDGDLSWQLDSRMSQLIGLLQDPEIQRRLQPWSPPIAIWEGEDKITFCVELPGVSKSDVDISLRERHLVVTGIRHEAVVSCGGQVPRVQEIMTGPFQKIIPLPRNFSGTEIDSTLRDGILEITIAKTESKTAHSKKSKNGSAI